MRLPSVPCSLLLAALLLPAPALAENAALEEGKALVLDLEEKRAEEVLDAVTISERATPQERAQAHLWIGIARVNLLEFDAAKQSFRSALKGDEAIAIPTSAAPKAQKLFEEARAEHLAAAAKKEEPQPAPVAATTAPPASVRGTLTTVAYVSGGVGVAALLGGAILGLSASGSEEAALAATDGATATTEIDSARSSANLANGLYVGGALLAASAVTLWVLDLPASGPAAAPAPQE